MNAIGKIESEVLHSNAAVADAHFDWPQASWDAIVRSGVLKWLPPSRYGGDELAPVDLLAGYCEIARHCLTTAFILSQREAATRYLLRGGNEALIERFARELVTGRLHVTLGISQLTTSRQHGAPAMSAIREGNGYSLTGTMPWVTAADRTDAILVGATLSDSRQILALVDCKSPGLKIGPPLELLAVRGSRTAEVRCDDVKVSDSQIAAGPVVNVMATLKGGTGGLETSALALGLVAGCRDWLNEEMAKTKRTYIAEWIGCIDGEQRRLITRMSVLSSNAEASGKSAAKSDLPVSPTVIESQGNIDAAAMLRSEANHLALRAADTILAVAKGAGFVAPHPAERFVRQARFFLVWSCPKPALESTVSRIWGATPTPE